MSNKDIKQLPQDNEQDIRDNSVSFTQLAAPVASHRTCATNSTNTTSLNSPPSSSSSFSIVPVSVLRPRITSNHPLLLSSQQSSSRMNNDSRSQTDESPPRSPRPHSSHRSSVSLSLSNNALDPRSPSPTLAPSLVSPPPSSASRVGTYSSSASTSNPPHLHLSITPVAPPASSFISHPNSPISSQMNPGSFLPLLRCPLCDPPALLSAPITLRCGHTVCTKHVISSSNQPSSSAPSSRQNNPLPPCPLPTCKPLPFNESDSHFLPRHPQSRVVYIPPPPAPPTPQPNDLPGRQEFPLREDVTVNKVMSLVLRSQRWFYEQDLSQSQGTLAPSRSPYEQDESTDTEDETDVVPELDGSPEHREPDPQSRFDLDHQSRSSSQPRPGTLHPFQENPPPFPAASPDVVQQDGSGPLPSPPDHPRRRPRSQQPPPTQARPRKRRRLSRTLPDGRINPVPPSSGSTAMGEAALSASARLEKELLAELTCEICLSIMWKPLTTPCQHTFCSRCLHRSLDHNPACPLCRQSLPSYNYFQDHSCNKLILAIILKGYQSAYTARGEAIEAEERDARLDTPIFVCQLCFPEMPIFLNFYEPRYRLMLRRCLETPHPCFGMVPPPRSAPVSAPPPHLPTADPRPAPQNGNGGGLEYPPRPPPSAPAQSNEFGTMLEIRNVQMLPDGQCRVEAWGTWRFRILERGSLDGYGVARVERIDDVEEEEGDIPRFSGSAGASGSSAGAGPSTSIGRHQQLSVDAPLAVPVPTYAELMSVCHGFLNQLREGTPWVVQHLNNAYVPMPEDPANFSFWMALLLPIDEHEKTKLLPIRSPHLRLRLVVHWIEQLNSNW